jgi:hypothetical protein
MAFTYSVQGDLECMDEIIENWKLWKIPVFAFLFKKCSQDIILIYLMYR